MTKSKALVLTFLFLMLSFGLTAQSSVFAQKTKSRRAKPTAKPPVELIAKVEPQAIAENWKPFSSPEGRFSIITPGKFEHTSPVAQTPEGPVQMQAFNYYANGEYSVTYADYLALIEGSAQLPLFLDGIRDAGLKGIKGRLLEEKEITLDGHPGRAYRIEYGTNFDYLLEGRYVVVGQRLYIIATTYGKHSSAIEGSYAEWSSKFLDSFKLTKPAE